MTSMLGSHFSRCHASLGLASLQRTPLENGGIAKKAFTKRHGMSSKSDLHISTVQIGVSGLLLNWNGCLMMRKDAASSSDSLSRAALSLGRQSRMISIAWSSWILRFSVNNYGRSSTSSIEEDWLRRFSPAIS